MQGRWNVGVRDGRFARDPNTGHHGFGVQYGDGQVAPLIDAHALRLEDIPRAVVRRGTKFDAGARAPGHPRHHGRRTVLVLDVATPQGDSRAVGGIANDALVEAVGEVRLVGQPAMGAHGEMTERAESGLRERHAQDVGGDERPIGELVERAVVRQVEAAQGREHHAATQGQRRVNPDVDRGVLGRDLLAGLLDLQLRCHPHEVADAGGGKEVEPLGDEARLVGDAVHPLVPGVRLGVSA